MDLTGSGDDSYYSTYKCNLCEKVFSQNSQLTEHKKTHSSQYQITKNKVDLTSDKLFKCDQCQKSFISNVKLLNHRRIHTGDMPYKCDICDYTSESEHNFLYHIHKNTNTNKYYKYDLFKKTFSQKIHITEFKTTHTSQSLLDKNEVINTYMCNVCETAFSNSSLLREHQKIYSDKHSYTCDLCEKEFYQECNMTIHKKLHTSNKIHQCDVCENIFSNESHLTKHKKIHTNGKLLNCKKCDKTFKNMYFLNKHNTIHTVKCNICLRVFSQQSHLTKHLKQHKSFKCNVCAEVFSNTSDFYVHKMIHSVEAEAPSNPLKNFVDCDETIKFEGIKEEIKEDENVVDPLSIESDEK